MAGFEFTDKLFKIDVLGGVAEKSLKDVLQINPSLGGHINNFTNGSTVIINSDRLVLNAKKDHLLICGKEGVTITSPKSIHLDSDDDIYLFSDTGEIYLGLPNKGRDYDFTKQKAPKTKGDPTLNYGYEPIVLGLKLANLLEDLIVLMRDAVIRTPAGDGHMSTQVMYNLENLHSRIPEMLSTVVFVDGVSHDKPDAAPPIPDDVTANINKSNRSGTAGNTTSGATATATGTNSNNTQSPAIGIAPTPNNNPDGVVGSDSNGGG